MSYSLKSITVCLSPELIHLYNLPGSVVVVVDILRASSCIVTGIAHGVTSFKPVASLNECDFWRSKGYVGAAERGGQKVEGFELGNSPFSYMDPELENQNIAFTTTNGTEAIMRSKAANQIIIGAFLNFDVMANYLKNLTYDIIVHCAGWNGKVNMEDTIFAGALINELKNEFNTDNDAALAAMSLYNLSKTDLKGYLAEASHYKRLQHLGLQKDIDFCFEYNHFKVIPILKNDHLVKMGITEMLF